MLPQTQAFSPEVRDEIWNEKIYSYTTCPRPVILLLISP